MNPSGSSDSNLVNIDPAESGTNGFDTSGNASALYAMVVAIRAALVANGIMS